MICYAALFFMGAWDKPVKMLGRETKQVLPDCQAAKKLKPTLQSWFYLSLNLHSFETELASALLSMELLELAGAYNGGWTWVELGGWNGSGL